eukprot:g2401.t1
MFYTERPIRMAFKRIRKELDTLRTDPVPGFEISVTDPACARLMREGLPPGKTNAEGVPRRFLVAVKMTGFAAGSWYEGATIRLSLEMDASYPFQPIKINFLTNFLHPGTRDYRTSPGDGMDKGSLLAESGGFAYPGGVGWCPSLNMRHVLGCVREVMESAHDLTRWQDEYSKSGLGNQELLSLMETDPAAARVLVHQCLAKEGAYNAVTKKALGGAKVVLQAPPPLQQGVSLGEVGRMELVRGLSSEPEQESKALVPDGGAAGGAAGGGVASSAGDPNATTSTAASAAPRKTLPGPAPVDGVYERRAKEGGGADDMYEKIWTDRLRLTRDGRAILCRDHEDNDTFEGYYSGGSRVLEGTYRLQVVEGDGRKESKKLAARFTWTSRKEDACGQPCRGSWNLCPHEAWRPGGEEPDLILLPGTSTGGGSDSDQKEDGRGAEAEGGDGEGKWHAIVDGRYRDDPYMGLKIEEGMVIFATTLTGKTLTLKVEPEYTIARVKELYADQTGIPPEQQGFMFNGMLMRDHWDVRTLSDLGVAKNDLLRCILRQAEPPS